MAKKVAEVFVRFNVNGLPGISSALSSIRGAITGTIGALGQLGLAINGIKMVGSGLASIAATPLKLAAEAEQIEVAMETMIGSADRAQEVLRELYQLGASTPFEFTHLAKASRTLLSFGGDVDDVVADVEMLSNIASGDSEKLQSLSLVFGQIQSTGKLMGQDLLQLINQGFNPLQQISERTGESMGALKKRMEQGRISFAEVKQAFVDATSEGGRFYQMNEKQSQTLAGVWSTFQDNIGQALIKIGKAIAFNLDLKAVVQRVSDWLGEMVDIFDVLTTNWGEAWEIMKLYVFGVIEQIKAYIVEGFAAAWDKTINGFKAAWEAMKVAMTIGKSEFKRQQERENVEMQQAKAQEDFARGLMQNRPELGLTERDLREFVMANARHERTGRIWQALEGEGELAGMLPDEEVQRFMGILRQFQAELSALSENQLAEFVELRRARLQAKNAGKFDASAVDAAGKGYFDQARSRFDALRRRRDDVALDAGGPVEAPATEVEKPMLGGFLDRMLLTNVAVGTQIAQLMAGMVDKIPKAMTTSVMDAASVNRTIQESMERRSIDLQKLSLNYHRQAVDIWREHLDVTKRRPVASFG